MWDSCTTLISRGFEAGSEAVLSGLGGGCHVSKNVRMFYERSTGLFTRLLIRDPLQLAGCFLVRKQTNR